MSTRLHGFAFHNETVFRSRDLFFFFSFRFFFFFVCSLFQLGMGFQVCNFSFDWNMENNTAVTEMLCLEYFLYS